MEEQNQQDLITAGDDAEAVLNAPAFTKTVNSLIDQSIQVFLNSKTGDSAERENSYRHYQALADIVATLQQQVAVRNQINEEIK